MSPMNNRLLVPRKTPGLLDLVPGAAAAYSLRSLSNSYADPVVTVRRSSDDDEGSFTASEVSDGTLAAFAGAGDAFVKQWWDQSGNANHASQTTPGYQPKIVSSGAVILEEGKPAIQFDGSDDRLAANGLAYVFNGEDNPFSVFLLASTDSSVVSETVFTASTASVNPLVNIYYSLGRLALYRRDGSGTGTDNTSGATLPSGRDIVSVTNTGTVDTAYLNGAFNKEKTANLGAITITKTTIGALDRTTVEGFFSGTISELIIYPSDISSQRELAEGLIAWGYSV